MALGNHCEIKSSPGEGNVTQNALLKKWPLLTRCGPLLKRIQNKHCALPPQSAEWVSWSWPGSAHLTKITQLNVTITTKITQLNVTITTKIMQLNVTITTKITQLNVTITTKITQLNVTITTKIMQLNVTITTKITQLNVTITTKITQLNVTITTKIMKLNVTITTKIMQLNVNTWWSPTKLNVTITTKITQVNVNTWWSPTKLNVTITTKGPMALMQNSWTKMALGSIYLWKSMQVRNGEIPSLGGLLHCQLFSGHICISAIGFFYTVFHDLVGRSSERTNWMLAKQHHSEY